MKPKQFNIIVLLIAMSLILIEELAIYMGNPVLAVIIFVAGAVAIYLCNKRVSEVLVDERIYQVSQKASCKASWITYHIVVLSFAIGGLVLLAMRNTYPKYADLGILMSLMCSGSCPLNGLLYRYYNKKYVG